MVYTGWILMCTSEFVYSQVSQSAERDGTVFSGSLPAHVSSSERPGEMSAIVDIFFQMRLAGRLMEQRDWQKTLTVQEQIIARLDELLRHNQPSAPPPATSPMPEPEASSQQQDVQSAKPSEQAQSPASGEVNDGQTQQTVDHWQEVRSVLRGLWGQLPDRLRSQIPETLAEEFLPRYAPLIRQYYRRLAELEVR